MSWIQRIAPLRLAAAAGIAAAIAIGLFAANGIFVDEGSPSGVRDLDAAALGLDDLAITSAGLLDSDLDSVPDAAENLLYGSDPHRWNSSGTPLPDGWLVAHGYSPVDLNAAQRPAATPPVEELPKAYANRWPETFTPSLLDVYRHDRPTDWDEARQGPFNNGLDPREWDSNQDGIPDGWLLHYGLDPLDDSLADDRLGSSSLTVRQAFEYNADPLALDSDGDGLPDSQEIAGPSNPRWPDGPARFAPTDPARFDTSGTGICDGYLVRNGLDPSDPAAAHGDPDRDGATTLEEYRWSSPRLGAGACAGGGLDPRKASSGGAPLPDGWLIRFGLDPLQPGVADMVTQKSTNDPSPDGAPAAGLFSLTVAQEYAYGRPSDWDEARQGPWWGGTDPRLNDTDGDGIGDAWELAGYRLTVITEPGQPPDSPYNATLDPTRADSDDDGLADADEVRLGSDGRRRDTDFDGLEDGEEAALELGLDPANADSAGDLLRDGERYVLLVNRSKVDAGTEYPYPGEPNVPARRTGDVFGSGDLAMRLGPKGDADDDDLLNIVDPDIDGDGLDNGVEVRPVLYASYPAFPETSTPRLPTDPLNLDTDGDELPDAWEVLNAIEANGRFSMDPTKWDSDGDCEAASTDPCTSDGHEDPDGDSVDWVDLEGTAFVRGTHVFDNLAEHQRNTDPNDPDTDGDGLLDGWEDLWGGPSGRLPDVPGGPLPDPGTPQPADSPTSELATYPYTRYALDGDALLPDLNDPGAFVETLGIGEAEVKDGDGIDRLAVEVQGAYVFRFHDAQRLGTNPHREDTDGDGMPDWWEDIAGRLFGLRSLVASEMGGCAEIGTPLPLPTDPADGARDPDQDGLTSAQEFPSRGDPLCADSDLGGLDDAQEVTRGLRPWDPHDDIVGIDGGEDSDGDGLTDVQELVGKFYDGLGIVKTDPENPDTDGDGLLDGGHLAGHSGLDADEDGCLELAEAEEFLNLGIAYQKTGLCYTLLGEGSHDQNDGRHSGDPRDGDDCGCSIPSGWLAAYGKGIDSGSTSFLDHYRLGRPSWWTEEIHGPWWGGASPISTPGAPDIRTLSSLLDLDGDGLHDRDEGGDPSEDPFPAANSLNELRAVAGSGDPQSTTADPTARRLGGQAHINPAPYLGTRPGVDHPVNPPEDQRAPTCIALLRVGDGSVTPAFVDKGTEVLVTGTVLRRSASGACTGAPVGDVAVAALMGGARDRSVFGGDFTATDGSFAIPLVVGQDPVPVLIPGSALTAFRGRESGLVDWEPDPSVVGTGRLPLLVRSYAHGPLAGPGDMRSEASTDVRIAATAVLGLDVPTAFLTGEPVPVHVQLHDSGGAPLAAAVDLHASWLDNPVTVVPDGGAAHVELPVVPADKAGALLLTATSRAAGDIPSTTLTRDDLHARGPGIVQLDPVLPVDAGSILHVSGHALRSTGSGSQAAVAGVDVNVAAVRGGIVVAEGDDVSSSTGTFAVDLRLPESLAAGDVRIVVAAAAGDLSTAGQKETTIRVRSLPQFTDVFVSNLTSGQAHRVQARLVQPDLSPVADAPVQVRLGHLDASTRTAANGTFDVRFTEALPVGTVLQTLSFPGDAAHAPTSHRVERALTTATRIDLRPDTLPRGGDARVPLALVTGGDAPVSGATVLVTWGDEPARSVVTDRAGKALFTRPGHADDALGVVLVKATYAGRGASGLGPSSAQAIWSVRSLATLDLPGEPIEAGGGAPTGRLLDAGTGVPLAGRTIALRVDDRPAPAVVTDPNGAFPLMPAFKATADPRPITVDASFAGDDAYPSVRDAVQILLRSPTTVHPQVPAVLVAGQDVLVRVDLADARGQPVEGGRIRALLGDAFLGSGVVDGGVARFPLSLPPTTRAGPATIEFDYLGSATHVPSRGSGGTDIVEQAILEATADAVEAGELAVLRVRLLVAGAPAPGRTVTIQMEGVPEGLGAITDDEGWARFEVTQVGDSLTFLARYGGDGDTSPATAAGRLEAVSPVPFFVRSAALLPWIVAAGALALAAAAMWGWRAGRHPLAPAFAGLREVLLAGGDPRSQVLQAYRALEDAALGAGILPRPARTPRLLQQALLPTLPAAAHPALDTLIAVFERARYGHDDVGGAHRSMALEALRSIGRSLAGGRWTLAPHPPTGVRA